MLFSELGLSAKVLTAVEATGYTQPTPIQEQAIPHALERRDVLGIAQTGTGKTASFVLPMLTLLEKGRARARMPRSLILEPTRELAAQVADSFTKYGLDQKLNVALLIGGMSFDEQDRKIDRGADVLIATPGRLLDHFERGRLLMTGVEILVIDEADRMLDMGFIPDIERICKMIPFTRQTLFFSATMPPEITRLTEQFLQNPVRIEVARPSSAAQTVEQRLVATQREDWEKRETLRKLIRAQDDITNAIIFCNRKLDVASLFRSLSRHGFSVGALHGDMDQRSRMAMLHNFRENKIQLLVASDVAARGLDIPAVSHVFNFDVPIHSEDYVHRIGRTGRAGRSGKAFTLVSRSDTKYLDAIVKMLGNELEWLDEVSIDQLPVPESTGEERGGRHHRGRTGDSSRRGGGRGRDRRSGGRSDSSSSSRGEELPDVEAEVRAAAPAAVVAGTSGNARRAPNGRNGSDNGHGRGNRGGQRDEATPVGFGDDVPAFMLIGTGL
ncbi:RNA helicase [Aureimonas endophytica]|uniref:DEAD-box ATP-dependent RNA helicase RhpA n=1 Tax=Aureimonas endophytica TaxID=2027858 RepID=A0A916ZDA7_9HYPH|nr:DEAD/DEAH box helicase [Aureimonas endophytica]GGD88710.1 RNA helicase [Aureimonas endophytica]